MSVLPVFVMFGLSFPPVFIELIISLMLFWLVKRVLTPSGIYHLSGIRHLLIQRFTAVCFTLSPVY